MDAPTTALLTEAAFALAIGLAIGLEREHRDVEEGTLDESTMGLRTFSLLSLFGWLGGLFLDRLPALLPVGLLAVGALMVVQYARGPARPGLTTEVAGLVTFALGAVVHFDRPIAVAAALATTVLLFSKPWVRKTLPKLRRTEITATLQLLVVLAVVLPLLPRDPVDPWGVLSPRKIGVFITLIAAISFVGYILNRALGPRRGTGLAGLVGGLVSSTAVTAAMAQEARRSADMVAPGHVATFLANTMMFARVLVVTTILSRVVAARLVAPFSAMGVVMLAAALWKWQVSRRAGSPEKREAHSVELKNPFALLPALKWGALLSVVLVLAALAKQHLGTRGLYFAAAAAGLTDVDAITLAVVRQTSEGMLEAEAAAIAITVAALSNTAVKGGIALISGGHGFGRDVAKVFGVVMIVGIAVAWGLG